MTTPHATGTSDATRPRLTTAGRLLATLAESEQVDLVDLARRLGIPATRLEECRQGLRPLELEAQMRLAAITLLVAPELRRRAQALYNQAQAALRMQAGEDRNHMTYPREFFR
ncbi:MAG TPA: hypothetical protein VEA99_13700 [Gemmatimonadaceae bacterium]|nr:hypothetical protein [Gemmatimonadaceae bacterium]